MKWFIKLPIIRQLIVLVMLAFNWLMKAISQWGVFRLPPKPAFWLKLSKFKRHFFSNFAIGVVIAVLLHLFHSTSWISQTENLAMDSMMYVNQGTSRMMANEISQDPLLFTFIDIDENTYRTWGEPARVPRDKLLQLIKYASQDSKARAIVVDIDFSNPLNKEDDQALLAFLKDYDENYPPLFLIRDFYPSSKYTKGRTDQIRPSILDQMELGENVFQAHPVFKHSTYDQVVRYWQLLEMGCLNNRTVVIPAFQLLIDAYLHSVDDLEAVANQLQKDLPDNCEGIDRGSSRLTGDLVYGERVITLDAGSHQRIGERIIYTLPWTGSSLASNELLVKPAHRLTEAVNSPSTSAVDGRVVIIGASFSDSRDLHQTPLGEMPGAVVILNAIKSLHLFGQIKPPSTIIKLLLELVLILFMSWAFARFSSTLGALTTTVLIVVVLLPLSFYFFKYGLWIDFAVPIMGMQFHQLVAKFEEDHDSRKRLKQISSEKNRTIK